MEFSSKLLERAVSEMSQLPGIGKRTALRLVLHLLKQSKEQTIALSQALESMRNEIKFCKSCHNISDVEVCEIIVLLFELILNFFKFCTDLVFDASQKV